MFEQDFEQLLRQYETALDDKKKFTALVKDLFPDQAKTVNLLLMAYNMGIAQDIQGAARINNTFAFRYVKQLMDDFGLSRVNADWIVSIWCQCYGEKVLGKKCDITVQKEGNGPAIQESVKVDGRQYGDLFDYAKSTDGKGLVVTGFHGAKKDTIIFQNTYSNRSVTGIAEKSFLKSEVEEAILTEGITYIGKEAFKDCDRLHQVILPSSMKEIGESAFAGCCSLKSIALPKELGKIESGAFRNAGLRTLEIPKSVYWLGKEVMAGCRQLEQIMIPDNIDSIPEGLLEGCTSLSKVYLHDQLSGIGDRAFSGCNSLILLVIPDSVTFIGDHAFADMDQQFIIQCSFGSYAEEYARKHHIKYQLV